MILKERIALMARLGQYFQENNADWQLAKEQAFRQNPWFIPESIEIATAHIARVYLKQASLEQWLREYPSLAQEERPQKEVGLVMAGNIPLVGFHDFLSIFVSGCQQRIKLSSKDSVLWQHICNVLQEWVPETASLITFSEQLKSCDAYIATGNNNSSRYFEYYFAKYPHIIRKNRSSIAVLTGDETPEMLAALCDDICLYFGLGCRNVTQLFVPKDYDFEPLRLALKRYESHLDYHRYKNNYDYQLALVLLNKIPYQTFDPVLLVPSESLFAPISVLHYQNYRDKEHLVEMLPAASDLQCIVGMPFCLPEQYTTVYFGQSQYPKLADYADGVNTLDFLNKIQH